MSAQVRFPRYRVVLWSSISSKHKDGHGLQVQLEKGKRWLLCCVTVGGVKRALVYTTAARAQEVCTALNVGTGTGPDAPRVDIHRGLVPLSKPAKKGGAS